MSWMLFVLIALLPATAVVAGLRWLSGSLAFAWVVGGAMHSFLILVAISVLMEVYDTEYDGGLHAIFLTLYAVFTSVVTTTLACGVVSVMSGARRPTARVGRGEGPATWS